MNRPTKLLLGLVLLGGVSAAALPVIAAEEGTPTAASADVVQAAWHRPGFGGHGPGPDGFGRFGPERFGRDGDGMRPMNEALLAMFDTNKDGNISKDEIEGVTADKLKTYDKDGDGSLSLTEYQALWLDQMREQMVRSFQRYDRDGDGKVTQAELGTRADNVLARLDRNHDGVIDQSELAGFGGRHHGMDDGDGPGAPPAPPAPPAPGK